jgi:hypothetical protein
VLETGDGRHSKPLLQISLLGRSGMARPRSLASPGSLVPILLPTAISHGHSKSRHHTRPHAAPCLRLFPCLCIISKRLPTFDGCQPSDLCALATSLRQTVAVTHHAGMWTRSRGEYCRRTPMGHRQVAGLKDGALRERRGLGEGEGQSSTPLRLLGGSAVVVAGAKEVRSGGAVALEICAPRLVGT